jgi:hypothetical protein
MRREDDNEYGMGRDIEGGGRVILHSAWRVPTFAMLDKESHRKRVTSLSLDLALTVLTSVNVNGPAAVPRNCLLGLVTKSSSHFVVRTSTV